MNPPYLIPIYKSGVYIIRNKESGKFYIGSSVDLERRWRVHVKDLKNNRHHSVLLQRAWNEDGQGALEFVPVLFCEPEEVLRYEQALIDCWCPEYNVAPFAGSRLGVRHSPETRARISAAHTGKHKPSPSPETRAKISASLMGKQLPLQRRMNMSRAFKNSPKVLETCRKMSLSNIGRKHSSEVRARMSAAQRGHFVSLEARAKMSASKIGKKRGPMSEEWKSKIGAANRGRKFGPMSAEHKEKIRAGQLRHRAAASLGAPGESKA